MLSPSPSCPPPPPTSEDRSDTGHLPTTIVAAFQQARTLAVHLALVLAKAELGEVSVHLGAGTLLFWGEKGATGSGQRGCREMSACPQRCLTPVSQTGQLPVSLDPGGTWGGHLQTPPSPVPSILDFATTQHHAAGRTKTKT